MTDTIRMLALSGLAYEDEAPLAWRTLPALPEDAQLQQLNAQIARHLIAEASLEEPRNRAEPKDESQPLFQELHRLESKIDIVLQLMSNLLRQQQGTPPRRKFRVHAQGLEWTESASSAPAEGTVGLASLYLSNALPFPIELPGQVTASFVANGETTLRMEFRGLSPQVADLIEKLIFRHHRRQIAEARQTR